MGKRIKHRTPGKSLEMQRVDFDPDSLRGESQQEVILTKGDFKRIKQLMFDVSRINSIRKLQERLVIWNVNEFMVRDVPTLESFLTIVNFQLLWSTRFLHLVKMTEERAQYLTQVNILASLSLEKFEKLSKRAGSHK